MVVLHWMCGGESETYFVLHWMCGGESETYFVLHWMCGGESETYLKIEQVGIYIVPFSYDLDVVV
jgi:hypothetical protein